MATITKKELIDRIALRTGMKRTDVRNVLQMFLSEVVEQLGNGNRLEFRDFGVFEIKIRAPRTAQNPKTLERVIVPKRKTVRFKVGRLFKQQLDSPRDGSGGPRLDGDHFPRGKPPGAGGGGHAHLDGQPPPRSPRPPPKDRPR